MSHWLRPPSKAVQAFWRGDMPCEEGVTGWRTRGSTYSGGLGFKNSTWEKWAGELGIRGRYPNAADAPPIIQIEVAEYGYSYHHGYWGSIEPNGSCAGWHP